MTIEAAWSGAIEGPGEALCTAHHGDDARHSPAAPHHHDHGQCLLCHASAAPLLATHAALLVPALVLASIAPSFFYALAGPGACHAHDAEARAPPALL